MTLEILYIVTIVLMLADFVVGMAYVTLQILLRLKYKKLEEEVSEARKILLHKTSKRN